MANFLSKKNKAILKNIEDERLQLFISSILEETKGSIDSRKLPISGSKEFHITKICNDALKKHQVRVDKDRKETLIETVKKITTVHESKIHALKIASNIGLSLIVIATGAGLFTTHDKAIFSIASFGAINTHRSIVRHHTVNKREEDYRQPIQRATKKQNTSPKSTLSLITGITIGKARRMGTCELIVQQC